MKKIIASLTILSALVSFSQKQKALFLGNSYTYFNDMPKMVVDIANSMGDSLEFEKNTPGGYTLQQHASTSGSLSKIYKGGWDFVVLQEQSQLPSFPISQVQTDVFFFAKVLDSVIHAHSSCAKTTFFMTWGRENGDASNCASWPPVCTYQGMDDLLRQRYLTMTSDNKAQVSPVGALWRYIRNNYPSINLYAGDGSHPSLSGSYAAACAFYTVFFQKDPRQISFNSTLSQAVADSIKSATKRVVLDSLSYWSVDTNLLHADFTYQQLSGLTVQFQAQLQNAAGQTWYIEDSVYQSANPIHTFKSPGTYQVEHVAYDSKCDTLSVVKEVAVMRTGITEPNVSRDLTIFPNPSHGEFRISFINLGQSSLSILSNQGGLVYEEKIETSNPIISLPGSITKGIYYVQIKSKFQVYHGRLLID